MVILLEVVVVNRKLPLSYPFSASVYARNRPERLTDATLPAAVFILTPQAPREGRKRATSRA